MQGFHAVPVHLPDVRLTYFGGSRPAPFQGHTLGCPLCPQVYVMVVVDIPPFVDTAERTVKVGNAALGFQMQPHRALAAFEGGFRGIGLAVLVKQFDVVELIREVVPQPLPVVDGKVFGVFRRRADLDADDGIFDPFGLLQRQPHRIPYTRGIQTGRQQIVPHVEDAFGMFLVPRFSRDVPDIIYPVGDGFRFPYHGSSSLSSPFLVPSGRRLENRTLSSTSVTRSASLPSSLSHSSMKG